MNLKTGTMTRGRDADVVFSSDGADIGANGIVDLGTVEFDSVNRFQDSGFQQLIKAVPGHVYVVKRMDGTVAKLKITSQVNSVVSFKYALEKSSSATTNVVKALSTETKLAYTKKPIKITVTATYMNGKKLAPKSGVVWKSSNTKVAKVSSNGVVAFTGQNGDVAITATYQGKKLILKTTVARVDSYYGKWKLWIPGTMVDYFYKGTGNYAGSKYTKGASNGSLTINKDGTYQLNGKKGKWRVAKKSEVFNHPVSIILLKAVDNYDVAVTAHDRKKGYIKLMTDSKGKYTDRSKIWIFGAEGYK